MSVWLAPLNLCVGIEGYQRGRKQAIILRTRNNGRARSNTPCLTPVRPCKAKVGQTQTARAVIAKGGDEKKTKWKTKKDERGGRLCPLHFVQGNKIRNKPLLWYIFPRKKTTWAKKAETRLKEMSKKNPRRHSLNGGERGMMMMMIMLGTQSESEPTNPGNLSAHPPPSQLAQ